MIEKDELNKKLSELRIEDFIWILYIGIIILSLYSNYLERKYYVNNDKKSKNKYLNVTIIIFIVLLIVYTYFFKSSYNSLKEIKPNTSYKKKELVNLSCLASLLVLMSGIIFLYIAINNKNLDVEIAFN